jgi:hypothetical protein
MTPERFRTIVDAYGADARRWPEAERAAAQAWASAHRIEADAIFAESAPLDAWLDGHVVAPPPRALFDGIVASAPARPPEGRAALPWGGVAQRQEGTTSAPARPPEGRAALPWGGVAQRQEGTTSAPARPPFWRRGRVWWSSVVFAGVGVAGGFVGAFAVSLYMVTTVAPPVHQDAPWLDTGFGNPVSDWSEE